MVKTRAIASCYQFRAKIKHEALPFVKCLMLIFLGGSDASFGGRQNNHCVPKGIKAILLSDRLSIQPQQAIAPY
jgi:hypothetical protein